MSKTSKETTGTEVKLSSLQDRCKRDPAGYRTDYDAQVRRLRSEVDILFLSPSSYNPSHTRLVELIQFIAAVSSSSYKGEESNQVAALLINLLTGNNNATASTIASEDGAKPSTAFLSTISASSSYLAQLHKDIRRACVSALMLMRNKGAIPPLVLLELFFQLMSTAPDKHIRQICYTHVVNDIKNLNKKSQSDKINRTVQTFIHKVIVASSSQHNASAAKESASDLAAKKCVQMASELYRRGVWTDERTVAILASASESPITSVSVPAMRFFLNIEDAMAEDEKQKEEEQWNSVQKLNLHLYSSKTKARQRHVEKQKKSRKREQEKHEKRLAGEDPTNGLHDSVQKSKKLYPAIEMLRDPQGLAEAVFKRVKAAGSNSFKFEVKLLMINFVTRLVGNHELMVLPLYPFLQRYMGGHQRDVTAILAYTVQACHEFVPPDEIYGVLKTISHNFITERCSGEQMGVGINAVRAICTRCPAVMNTDEDTNLADGEDAAMGTKRVVIDMEGFAQDLAAYAKHRDRSAAVAGRAWVNFVREVYPALLAGKDRGTLGSALARAGEKPLRYGEQKVSFGVEGADLLVEYEAKKAAYEKRQEKGDDDGDADSWETDDEGETEEMMIGEVDSDEDQWVDVDDEEEEEENDVESSEEGSDVWEEVEDDESDEEQDGDEEEEDEIDDEEAPDLVNVDLQPNDTIDETEEPAINLSKLSDAERKAIQQNVSATRIFSAADFDKMRKLVARAEKDKRDPRAAARRKRLEAGRKGFEELSDDGSDSDSDDDNNVRVTGAVLPDDIMAEARRKRQSKAEKLEKIVAGREKFQHKQRPGGSTNEEKKRKKNFLMQKFSHEMRERKNLKETAVQAKRKRSIKGLTHEAKKRRRKL